MAANPGVLHHRAKLSEEDVLLIRKVYGTTDVTQRQLAEEFGLNQKTVCEIVNRKIWKHLP